MRNLLFACCFLGLLRSPGQATETNPLNVLFVVSDDLNCDLGCYGHSLVQSPHIDRLAAQGLRFNKAYCQYPVCNPSRSSFMTSLYPEQTGVLSNGGDFRKRHPELATLSQLFMNNGYYVARVGKIFHYGVPLQIGTNGADDLPSWMEVVNPIGLDRTELDRVHTLQKGQYGGTLSWLNLDSPDEEQTDGQGALAAIRLMEEHHPDKTGKPFFLALGFYRPHTPYVAPSQYFELYDRDEIRPVLEKPGDRDDIPPAALADRPKQRELTIEQRKEIIQAYYASVSYMDAQLGRVLDALDRLKLREQTIVVFCSDHGYHLGHHGLWQKSDLFEGSARVPLIISPPRYDRSGDSTDSLVELLDLYPTLAKFAGLQAPEHVRGIPLQPILVDPSAEVHVSAYTVSNARGAEKQSKGKLGHSVRTSRYRYTEWGDNGQFGKELYDYELDPDEFTNLAVTGDHTAVVDTMRKLLEEAKVKARWEE
ncbi:MAG: sulfatase [Planctomycetaceae bacterium]|nr:sulfatase [Planctomycetaceae bacterium]